VVVKVHNHSDFDALTAATDWPALQELTTPHTLSVHTIKQGDTAFSTETIVERIKAMEPRAECAGPTSVPTTVARRAGGEAQDGGGHGEGEEAETAVGGGAGAGTTAIDEYDQYSGLSEELRPYLAPPRKVLELYVRIMNSDDHPTTRTPTD
jgi:hypothetical protein